MKLNILGRFAALLLCVFGTHYAQSQNAVGLRSETIGSQLDSFADRILNSRENDRAPFADLKGEINSVFFSTPVMLRLIATQNSLSAVVESAESLRDFQIAVSTSGGQAKGSTAVDGSSNSQTLSAVKSLYDFGAIDAAVDKSKSLMRQSMADITEQRSASLLQLIEARIQLGFAQQELSLSNAFYEARKEFLHYIEEKRELGVSSEAELVRAKAKLYQAEAAMPEAFRKVAAAKSKYEELFGQTPPNSPVFTLPSRDLLAINENQIIDDHPVILMAREDLASANADIDEFRASGNGTFNLSFRASRIDNVNSDVLERYDSTIEFTRDLGDARAREANETLLVAARDEYTFRLEELKRSKAQSVRALKLELSAAEASLAGQQSVLEATRLANRATKDLFAYDRGSLSDVFRVQEDYVDVLRDVVRARASLQITYYSLMHDAGVLLAEFELTI